MEGEAVSVGPCCSLGDEGAEESGVAISSISEYEEADLGPFFILKALLKELRSQLFFFFFFASASLPLPTLEWLVMLLRLEMLSEEFCLLIRSSLGVISEALRAP